jgi:hypothetical protein
MNDQLPALGALPPALSALPAVTVVCGHYGVGKTNFSINLAIDAARAGRAVTLIDMDVVNPYFRSSDYAQDIEGAGASLIAPDYAGTSLDTPVLSGAIEAAIDDAWAHPDRLLVIDAGGDDVGATALGRVSAHIAQGPYAFLYVVNGCREQTRTPQEAAELLPDIERQARLRATAIVNNTHLARYTDAAVIERGVDFAEGVGSLLDMPILAHTVPHFGPITQNGATLAADSEEAALVRTISARPAAAPAYVVQLYVRTPWDRA